MKHLRPVSDRTDRRLVTADVVAEATGQPRRTVLHQAARGELPHYRFGRNVRFDLDEVLTHARRHVGAPARGDNQVSAEDTYQLLVH